MRLKFCPPLIVGACLMISAFGCSPRPGGNLGSIPSTFTGTLEVQPKGRFTKELYLNLVQLAQLYGMDPRGDGASDGKQWQIQIFCGSRYMGGATTARNGDFVMFGITIYPFKEAQNYDQFKMEMLELMKPYGNLSVDPEGTHLSEDELSKRSKHAGFDVTSKCRPAAPSH